ncbi:MAG TPA: S24 family peptidase [Chloroflexia bacterium]|nr:S24 family peptidase [Chloroflexia bacterium]
MPDPRWIAPRAGADPLAPGLAPAWGAFERVPGAGVVLRVSSSKLDELRVLGTEPVAAAPRRNTANSRVYVLDGPATSRKRRDTVPVPVVGEIAAGQYDVTIAHHDYDAYEYGVEVDRGLVERGSGTYALRVRGTSMTHVGIEPGDLVVVKPDDRAENGDFVVARLTDSDDPEGYVTLKRFYRKRDHIFLQSATADREPIRLYPFGRGRGADRDRVKVQGRVIVVIKNR